MPSVVLLLEAQLLPLTLGFSPRPFRVPDSASQVSPGDTRIHPFVNRGVARSPGGLMGGSVCLCSEGNELCARFPTADFQQFSPSGNGGKGSRSSDGILRSWSVFTGGGGGRLIYEVLECHSVRPVTLDANWGVIRPT